MSVHEIRADAFFPDRMEIVARAGAGPVLMLRGGPGSGRRRVCRSSRWRALSVSRSSRKYAILATRSME